MRGILLYIRVKQLSRELKGIGPGMLLILGFIWFLVYTSFSVYKKTPEAYYLTLILAIITLAIHLYRNDKAFVYQNINKPQLEILSEYVLFTLPFSICSLFTSNWICFPFLLILLFSISLIRYTPKQKTYFKHLSSVIPPSNFEWISGFRRSFYYIIPLYLLALFFSWFKVLPLFFLWLITLTVISFYNEFEPIHILREGDLSVRTFLKTKIIKHSTYLTVLYLPVLVINTIFNLDYWEINLLFIPIQISLLCFAICFKYNSYVPNETSVGNNLVLSLVSIGSVIPYLLSIPLIMAMEYYRKAKKNLEEYL